MWKKSFVHLKCLVQDATFQSLYFSSVFFGFSSMNHRMATTKLFIRLIFRLNYVLKSFLHIHCSGWRGCFWQGHLESTPQNSTCFACCYAHLFNGQCKSKNICGVGKKVFYFAALSWTDFLASPFRKQILLSSLGFWGKNNAQHSDHSGRSAVLWQWQICNIVNFT